MTSNSDTGMNYVDLQFGLASELGNAFSGIANINLDLSGLGDIDQPIGDETFVGLTHDTYGTLTVGYQVMIMDDEGLGYDNDFGPTTLYLSDYIDLKAKRVVKYQYVNDNFFAGTSYANMSDETIFDDAKNSDGTDRNFEGDSGSYAVDANFGLTMIDALMVIFYAGYYELNDKKNNNKHTINAQGLDAEYIFNDMFAVSASLSNVDF